MTALLPPYTVGTVSVSSNGTVVTGSSTLWTDLNAREGDWLRDPATGYLTVISARVDATHLTVPAWKGSAITAGAYQIFPYSPLRFAGGTAMADVQKLLDTLNGRTFYTVIGASPDADGLVADQDQYALKTNGGGWQLWRWNLGAWELQAAPAGVAYRGEWSGATAYVTNDRVSRNGQSFTAKQANTNHDPATDASFTYWDGGGIKGDPGTNGTAMRGGTGAPSNGLGVDGDRYFRDDTSDVYVKAAGAWSIEVNIKGATGATPAITGTSTSLVSVGSGAKTFATQAGIAWVAGMRLRAVNAGGDRVMVGMVASYAGTSLTLTVDTAQGTGSDNGWTIAISGEAGQQGGAGVSGPGGTQGIQGIKGDTGAASTVPGPKGDTGQGFSWNASGTLAQRATYDGQTTGYAFLETDVSPYLLWVKASNTSADWAGPTPIGGNVPVGDLGLVTDSILQSFDYGVAA